MGWMARSMARAPATTPRLRPPSPASQSLTSSQPGAVTRYGSIGYRLVDGGAGGQAPRMLNCGREPAAPLGLPVGWVGEGGRATYHSLDAGGRVAGRRRPGDRPGAGADHERAPDEGGKADLHRNRQAAG